MAVIFSITYQPPEQKYSEDMNAFIRVHLATARLIAGHGLDGDDKAGRNPNRQLNILSHEWLQARQAEGFDVKPGAFGEQLILMGLPQEAMQAGDRLRLGQTACVEIVRPRTGCERLEAAQGRPIAHFRDAVGMMARIITSGTIAIGDTVRRLPPAAS